MIVRFCCALAVFSLVGFVLVQAVDGHVEAADCASGATAADLDAFFSRDGAVGMAGADYAHAFALPDGRTLWLLQDAFWNPTGQLTGAQYAHNAALVQTNNCFEVAPRVDGEGPSWIGSSVEAPLENWFWPLDAEIGSDGHLWLFLASMRNVADDDAGGLPSGTWRARLALPSLRLVDLEPASDSSRSLFGYSIVSDDEWTYLFANCYRQFTSAGFDPACSPYVYVARVPKGELDEPLEYWNGSGWSDRRDDRQPVMTGDTSLAPSVERFGDTYVSVSDDNEWFGSELVVRTAKAPQGPWSEVSRFSPETKCAEHCHNYGPFILPRLENDQIVIVHSNNAWDMEAVAYPEPSIYRLDVLSVAVAGIPGAPLADTADAQVVDPADDPTAAAAAPGGLGERTVAVETSAENVPLRPSQQTEMHPLTAVAQFSLLGLAVVVMASGALGIVLIARAGDPVRRRRALQRLRARGDDLEGATLTGRHEVTAQGRCAEHRRWAQGHEESERSAMGHARRHVRRADEGVASGSDQLQARADAMSGP